MFRTWTRSIATAVCLLTAGAVDASSISPLPSRDDKGSALDIRFVRYAGGSNGSMVVENRRRANPEIQSHVWKTRNKEWLKIEGEGAQEANRSTSPRETSQLPRIQLDQRNLCR